MLFFLHFAKPPLSKKFDAVFSSFITWAKKKSTNEKNFFKKIKKKSPTPRPIQSHDRFSFRKKTNNSSSVEQFFQLPQYVALLQIVNGKKNRFYWRWTIVWRMRFFFRSCGHWRTLHGPWLLGLQRLTWVLCNRWDFFCWYDKRNFTLQLVCEWVLNTERNFTY